MIDDRGVVSIEPLIVCLFGPPGAGRSTLISVARSLGLPAVNLADTAPHKREEAFALVEHNISAYSHAGYIGGPGIVSMADGDLDWLTSVDSVSVLLLPRRNEYSSRCSRADLTGNLSRDDAMWSEWQEFAKTRHRYDYVLDASESKPTQTLMKIISLGYAGYYPRIPMEAL